MTIATEYTHQTLNNNMKNGSHNESDAGKAKKSNQRDWETSPPEEAEWCEMPDKGQYQEDMNYYDEQINNCKNEINMLTPEVDKLRDRRNALQAKIKDLSISRKETRAQKNDLFEQLKKVNDHIDMMKKGRTEEIEKLKSLKKSLPFDSLEAIDNAVLSIEQRISSENMSIRDERHLISKIKSLNSKRSEVRDYLRVQSDFEAKPFNVKDLLAKKDEIKVKVDAIKKEDNENYEALQGMRESLASIMDELKVLYGKRNDLQETQNKIYEERKEAVSDHKKNTKEYFKYKEWAEYTKWLERKEFREEQRLLRLQEEAEFAAKEALRDPYEEQKAMCISLKSYFESLLPNELNTSATKTEVEAVQDGEDDFFAAVKPKKSSKKSFKKKKLKNSKVVLSPDVLRECSMLKIVPPSNSSQIVDTIKKIKELEEYYTTAPRPEISKTTGDDTKEAEDEEVISHTPPEVLISAMEEERERRVNEDKLSNVLSDMVRSAHQNENISAMEEERISRVNQDKFGGVIEDVVRNINKKDVVSEMKNEKERRVNEQKFDSVVADVERASKKKEAIEAMEVERAERITEEKRHVVMDQLERSAVAAKVAELEEAERARKIADHPEMLEESSNFRKVLKDSVPEKPTSPKV